MIYFYFPRESDTSLLEILEEICRNGKFLHWDSRASSLNNINTTQIEKVDYVIILIIFSRRDFNNLITRWHKLSAFL